MEYAPKNFDHLLGLGGFSPVMLRNHFTLYQGYVTNVNKLLAGMKTASLGTPEYAEAKRRFPWEWNGMRLHELYFENMAKGGNPLVSGVLEQKITHDFGSYEAWLTDFKATGAMRGIGWVILSYDALSDRLSNVWISEHDMGHLAGTKPLLVMDVFEHAFMIDYGLKRADYIESFLTAIDWGAVEKRLSN